MVSHHYTLDIAKYVEEWSKYPTNIFGHVELAS